MINLPTVKLGIVAVSRDCFPVQLSAIRRENVVRVLNSKNVEIFEAKTTVENENDVQKALNELSQANVNALVLYLGNFGPEGPETLLISKFSGPSMIVAAAEETQANLVDGRGDAYCGMLNASYNLALRNLTSYIPEYPVGTADEISDMIADFSIIARIKIGLSKLKILSFGPRPHDFLACNAPIKPLFDLGVEIMENSELDLFESFNQHQNDKRIPDVVKEMTAELNNGGYKDLLPKLAQFELTLLDFMENNKGISEYVAFANKCWPAFQTQFGFVPCYVNSRFAAKGIPIACETDIYGALSEYILTLATNQPATLLDINNSVPFDMFDKNKALFKDYKLSDLFMGFHCGNTPACCMKNYEMKYQLIMRRLLEPDSEPNISRGTLEGNIKPGKITFFRLQSSADCKLRSYIAEGEIIDLDSQSFGGIGIFAIPEMGRFYRHVLIEKNYPHHGGVGFDHIGKVLFEVMKMLKINDLAFNQPKNMLYKTENPFTK